MKHSATRTILNKYAVALAVLIAVCGMTGRAWAVVKFCNNTGTTFRTALAYGTKDAPGTSTGGDLGVTAEGWWTLKPGECKQVKNIDANSYWLYFRTESRNSDSGGSSMLCVQDNAFTLGQRFGRAGDRCKAGQRLVGFTRFDADKKNWTLNLK